jgi:hypothetical protein
VIPNCPDDISELGPSPERLSVYPAVELPFNIEENNTLQAAVLPVVFPFEVFHPVQGEGSQSHPRDHHDHTEAFSAEAASKK